jgi:DNA polymerase III alpha subunit
MTAYLKAHYPVEFMAALLSGDIPGRNFQKKDALVEHLEDCHRMGIDVQPPDVNRSGVDFTVAGGKIQFGLSAIKGCGGSAGEAIVAARGKGGPFRDLFDFCERVDSAGASRATIETLVKAGAFDGFGARRAQLVAAIDRAVQSGASLAADKKSGQKSLFGASDDEVAKPAISFPSGSGHRTKKRCLASISPAIPWTSTKGHSPSIARIPRRTFLSSKSGRKSCWAGSFRPLSTRRQKILSRGSLRSM